MTGTDVRAGSCRYLLNQQTLSILGQNSAPKLRNDSVCQVLNRGTGTYVDEIYENGNKIGIMK